MALTASPTHQALLLELQAFDTKISQLEYRAKKLPELEGLKELAKHREKLQLSLLEERGIREDIASELGRIESDVSVVEARISRDTERLNSTSVVKEAAAFEHELAALRTRLSNLEDIEIAVMERMERQQKVVDNLTEQGGNLGSEVSELEAKRDESLREIESELSTTRTGRNALQSTIPEDLLSLYERQRSRYGTGASLLRGGVSQASGVKLLENEMQEIRAASPDAIIMCASSEAILVRTDQSGL
ncbi:MAG: zinc ribbon domain-containing protein [Rhodoglobus sp.]